MLVKREMGALFTCMSCHPRHSALWYIVHSRAGQGESQGDMTVHNGNLYIFMYKHRVEYFTYVSFHHSLTVCIYGIGQSGLVQILIFAYFRAYQASD